MTRRSLALVGVVAAVSAPISALQIPLQQPVTDLQQQQQQPLAAPIDSLTPIDSDSLQARIKIENLQHRAESLYKIAKLSEEDWGHPTRVIGSPGHLGTLKYIRETLASLGGYYDVSDQTFSAVTGNVAEYKLVVGNTVPNSTTAFGLTPPTKDKEPVHGNLVLAHGTGCKSNDFSHKVKGNIAIVRRGECPFGDKSANAGAAGAKALIVVSDDDGELHGTLGTPTKHQVATFGLSKSEGEGFIEQLEQGDKFDTIAYMDAEVQQINTINIIAQTTHGDPDNCVLAGGHSDSVAEGPGINDDGSGSLSILEVAVQLSKYRVNNCVRFAWWAAEEEGLLGSDHYAAHLSPSENQKIRVSFDYDMMASPNFAYQVYNSTNDENPQGSEEIRDLYTSFYTERGLNYTLIPFDGRSDYVGFIRHGIPAGGIATGAEGVKTDEEETMFGGKAGEWYDQCYHQLCDGLQNLNLTAWEVNTKLIAHSIATYGRSFDGFPERGSVQRASQTPLRFKYRGHKLIM